MPFRPHPPRRRAQSDLFTAPSPLPPDAIVASTDGGARGNPGPAGYGVVIEDAHGKGVAELSEYLGHQTNNYAEYRALLAALEYAVQHGFPKLKVRSDSELMVKQIKGQYKVNNPVLLDLHAQAKRSIGKLQWFDIEHVLRGKNADADRLANDAMDHKSGKIETSGKAASKPVAPPIGREFNGIVKDGVVELIGGELPDGTKVRVKVV